MDSVALWLESEGNGERVYQIERRRIRDKSNIMELSDESFVKNYRLSKETFMYLLNNITKDLSIRRRQSSVPNIIKLSATLKLLSTGGYQNQIGGDMPARLSQKTLSKIIKEVLTSVEKVMCSQLVNFKMSDEEKRKSKRHFWEKSGIPGVIGVVDGTHIQLIRPTNSEQLFFNRKLKHSINVMVICDYTMAIRSVNGRYGGASHDSHVWALSAERAYLKRCFENGDKS
ncbi:putative nuclease HARBI1 [Eupeodes corollae]|uniref:putative nuclease HARBI1 n=1 Tax=Eupeodes corollae TaxID=290404 RepID=UPI002490B107|nr:putative nuclease HARBI1 [Eupeodes corollae]